MHRVHHFDTSEDAHEASLNEWDVREGDVLVIEAERVLGLGSTEPIAVTVAAGALKTIPPMTRDQLLAELAHGAPEIGYAVEEALRHGWEVAPHYLGFAGSDRCLPPSETAVILTLDDVTAAVDAINHRLPVRPPTATRSVSDPERHSRAGATRSQGEKGAGRRRLRGLILSGFRRPPCSPPPSPPASRPRPSPRSVACSTARPLTS